MLDSLDSYFAIGKIIGPRGLKGELRVYPLTDEPSRFGLLQEVTLEFPPQRGGAPIPSRIYIVETARSHEGIVFLKLAGVDDMTAAEKLRGAAVKIPPEAALPLGEGEYYIRDLIDMEVVTEEGEALGKLTDVLHTGANDVYVAGEKLMIPAIKECILKVDVPGKKMTVALMEGLRDL
ncbi:MAG: ribosome maturation factor RimM [Defluviitaleaceae bacterium]|nr:ribosome maturation factor RimM [Defluviitaleaceae bacterium]